MGLIEQVQCEFWFVGLKRAQVSSSGRDSTLLGLYLETGSPKIPPTALNQIWLHFILTVA